MDKLKAAAIVAIAAAAAAGIALAQAPAPTKLAPVETPPGKVAAVIDLGSNFPEMKGYAFTQTVTTVPPGTGRAWHAHKGAPEIVHIISGTLTDQRNGGPATQYGPGSTLINDGPTNHMWANLGTEPVVFVNTNVRVPAPPAK